MSIDALKGKKVGVLLGGLSAEREVSLKTGEAVLNALLSRGYDAVGIDVDHKVATRLVDEKIDIAFIALHGRFGEDGVIQGMLEMMGIPYTGSGVLASAVAMNKIFAKRMFAGAGIDIADYRVLNRNDSPTPADIGFALPVVIKPSQEGSSVGVSIVKDASEIAPAMAEAFRYDEEILVEQFIKGREIQVGIIEDRAVGAIEIVPKKEFYDFEAKYTPGMADHIFPAPLPEELYRKALETGIRAHQALGCSGYSRVDLLVNEVGVCYVLEVNTLPGMTATSLLPEIAAGVGIPFEELVEKILLTAVSRRNR